MLGRAGLCNRTRISSAREQISQDRIVWIKVILCSRLSDLDLLLTWQMRRAHGYLKHRVSACLLAMHVELALYANNAPLQARSSWNLIHHFGIVRHMSSLVLLCIWLVRRSWLVCRRIRKHRCSVLVSLDFVVLRRALLGRREEFAML